MLKDKNEDCDLPMIYNNKESLMNKFAYDFAMNFYTPPFKINKLIFKSYNSKYFNWLFSHCEMLSLYNQFSEEYSLKLSNLIIYENGMKDKDSMLNDALQSYISNFAINYYQESFGNCDENANSVFIFEKNNYLVKFVKKEAQKLFLIAKKDFIVNYSAENLLEFQKSKSDKFSYSEDKSEIVVSSFSTTLIDTNFSSSYLNDDLSEKDEIVENKCLKTDFF